MGAEYADDKMKLVLYIYIYIYIQCISQAMDPTIVLVALFAVAAMALLPRIVRRMRFVRRVDKIPGPPAYPIVGTLLPLLLAPRNSKYDGDLQLVTVELTLGPGSSLKQHGISSLTRLVHRNCLWH